MTDPKDKDPAEGSRETIENELKCQKPADEKSSRSDEKQTRSSS